MTSACGLVFVPMQFLRPSPGFYIVYDTPSRAPPASAPVNVAAVSPVYTFLSTNSDVRIRLRTCDSYINYNEEYYIFSAASLNPVELSNGFQIIQPHLLAWTTFQPQYRQALVGCLCACPVVVITIALYAE